MNNMVFDVNFTVYGDYEEIGVALEKSNFTGVIDTEFKANNKYTLLGQVKGDVLALSNLRNNLKHNFCIIEG